MGTFYSSCCMGCMAPRIQWALGPGGDRRQPDGEHLGFCGPLKVGGALPGLPHAMDFLTLGLFCFLFAVVIPALRLSPGSYLVVHGGGGGGACDTVDGTQGLP